MLLDKSDFLNWGFGEVLENRTRGILAEYIVATGLDALSKNRVEWDYCDIHYKGVTIEVKSAAYVQSWDQEKPSIIGFEIGTRRQKWVHETNKMVEVLPAARLADIYVFCLLDILDRKQAAPLDTEQWRFFVVPTATINQYFGTQKRAGLASIQRIAEACDFGSLRAVVDRYANQHLAPPA